MKLKKIISIISAFMLCASFVATSVNAELSYDADSDVLTMPTIEELNARDPKITLTAKKAESKDDVVAAGVPSKQAGNYYKEGYDAYVVTMTATNIGDLAVGYTDDTYETQTGLCVPAISLYLNNDAKIQKYTTKTSEAVAPFVDKTSIGVQGDTLAITFGSATNVGYSYPAFDAEANGQFVDDPTITTQFVICLNTGDTLDLTATAEFTYVSLTGSVGTPVIKNLTLDTLTLGSDDKKVLGYEADLAYDGVSTGFQFVAERTDADVTVASDVVTLPSVENLGNVKLGLNIENIPADKTLDDIKAVLNVFARWVK